MHQQMRSQIPAQSLLFETRGDYEYADCFKVALLRDDVQSWELVAALFHSAPPWFDSLAKLRDRMVSVLGLKTSSGDPKGIAPPYEVGQRVGFFRVLQWSDSEVVLGDDDSHLDFRTSLMTSSAPDGSVLSVSTVVRTKNGVGRVYFGIVRHFHRLIVPIMTRGMARLIDERALPKHFYASMKR